MACGRSGIGRGRLTRPAPPGRARQSGAHVIAPCLLAPQAHSGAGGRPIRRGTYHDPPSALAQAWTKRAAATAATDAIIDHRAHASILTFLHWIAARACMLSA